MTPLGSRERLAFARTHELEELEAFAQTALHHVGVLEHRPEDARDGARTEVVGLVELLDVFEYLVAVQAVVLQDGGLLAPGVGQFDGAAEPVVLFRLLVKLRAWIRRGQAHLKRERVDLLGVLDGLADRLVRFARQPEDERPVDGDAELLAVLRELAGLLQPDALLDVVEYFLVAALVADQEEAQAVVAHDLEGLVADIGAGVATPHDAELPELHRDLAGADGVGREGVVVEKEFLHLREERLGVCHLAVNGVGRFGAVLVPADRLRPEAEGALRGAAPPRVVRDVRVFQIPDDVVLDGQVALVDIHHARQVVEALDELALLVMDEFPLAAIRDAVDGFQGFPLGEFLAGKVKFLAAYEVDG